MTEKRRPHYILDYFKKLFSNEKTRIITKNARKGSASLGYMTIQHIIEIIDKLRSEHFFKSMTTYQDHKVWQDVYLYTDGEKPLYIKLQLSFSGKEAVLIQMKRNEGSEG